MGSGIDDIVIGAALVGKALTVAVHLEERLGTGVVLADGAGESLAAKGALTLHITAIHAGGHDAAVEQHGSSFLIQVGACPDSGTDAVTLIGRRVGAGRGDRGTQRVQLLHHVGVAREAAAGQQDAAVGVVADEVAILRALGDDARDTAVRVLFQFGKAGLEVHGIAQFLDVLLQQNVAGRAGLGLTGHVVVLLHREEVIGVVLAVLIRPLGLVPCRELALPAVLVFQDAAHEIVHGGRLVDPGLDDPLVALAGSIAGDLAQELGLISGGSACVFGSGGIDGTVPVAGVLHGAVLLHHPEVQAVGSGIGSGKHAAVACTDDNDVGVDGLSDGSLIDVRLLAQPVGLIARRQLDRSHGCLALGLCKAALGGFHHGVRGDGGAGNTVDLAVGGREQLLLELVGSGSAVGSGLAGGIHHHIGHSAVRERHGDLDGRRDALRGALIGTGDVAARGSGSCTRRSSTALTGGQSTCGHTGHGSSGCDFQKAFAGNLVHGGLILSLLRDFTILSAL